MSVFLLKKLYRYVLLQGTQKCDRFWFIHILSNRFNPIRSQPKTDLESWFVNVYMKECELIKGGRTFGLLAVIVIKGDHLVVFHIVSIWEIHWLIDWSTTLQDLQQNYFPYFVDLNVLNQHKVTIFVVL